MRFAAASLALAFALGCGGQPVGGKVPAAKPAHVAGAAAAAAALVTLADPDAARQGQEDRGGDRNKDRSKKSGGTVPEHVLFAPASTDGHRDDDDELPPCKKKASETKVKSSQKTVDFLPPTTERGIAKPVRCRDADEKQKTDGDEPGEGKERE